MTLEYYLTRVILPRYSKFDSAHSIDHGKMVMESCIKMARKLRLSENIAMTCGAFHDLGLSRGREGHELRGGKIVREDKFLHLWFNTEDIEIIAQAVEDHRSTLNGEPRSIYGKILSDSDRIVDPKIVIPRCIGYQRENYPSETEEEIITRAYEYLRNKYGPGGRVKLWISGTNKEKELNHLRSVLRDKKLFKKYI